MSTRPSLIRSVPFWVLVAGSIASAAAGGAILADKISVMTTTLTDGSATGIEVYVGQTVAIVGAVLAGAGVIGILLALTVASLATLRPVPTIETVEPIDWTEQSDVEPAAAEDAEPTPALATASESEHPESHDELVATSPR